MESLFFFILLVGIGILLLVMRGRYGPVVTASGQYGTEVKQRQTIHAALGILGPVLIGLGILVIAAGSFVTVDPGEVGIKIFFGETEPDILDPGFHVINPLLSVARLNTQTQAYTMSAKTNEGQVKGDDAIQVLSSDGLTLTLEVTVQYHLLPSSAPKVYSTIGNDYVEKIVRPEIRSALRDAAVNYLATDLYASKRVDFTNLVRDKLIKAFTARGIVLESVLLRDILLPEKVRTAIDEKIAAEQESQKMQYVLQRESQEADRKRIEAGGISDAQKIIAGSLTNQYLQYNYITTLKELVNSKNSTFVITPFDSKLTPMLNVNSK
jgi:regulator of protease activity HflC (stomatin/prohibitin superfamily)